MIKTTPLPPPPRGASGQEMVRRQKVLMRTMAQFAGKAFDLGRADCARLVRAHLVNLGHRKLPALPKYRSPTQARAALVKMGGETLEQVLDGVKGLTRIAPAAMLPGDIGLMDGKYDDGEIVPGGTAFVSAGGNKALAWHETLAPLAIVELLPGAIVAAWRA